MNLRTLKAPALAAALLFLGAAGCTDTTVQPKSSVSEANIFSDPNSYTQFLAKIYAGLALSGQQGAAGNPDLAGFDEGFSQYLRLYWELQELPTDEAIIAWNDVGLPALNTAAWTSTNGFTQTMYYRIMYQVALANAFLDQTTDAKLASRGANAALVAKVHGYRAEARFLRALSYYHAIDLFGSVPLITTISTALPQQVARDSLYRFVVKELNAIKDSLPAPVAANYARATTMAAHMLLANLYLNAKVYTGTADWADALTEAQTVISSGAYSLAPKYQNNFLADNRTSPEMIFPIAFDGQKSQTWGGATFLVHASCGGDMSNTTYGIDGCWWGLRLKPEAYNLYNTTADHPAGDFRTAFMVGPNANHTLAVSSISDFTKGVASPKFQNVTSTGAPGSNATFPDTHFPVFRLADAYLIYAEAQLNGGGGSAATALNYINLLRDRAYQVAPGGTGEITAGQLTLPFILAERGRELLWEGHRRQDLIRFGLFTGGTYLWAWKGGVIGGAATDSHLNLYPIPASELAANPNITQNPGY